MPSYTEEDVTNALNALVNGEYKSICKAAIAFQIPPPTLRDRRKKSKSKTETESHLSQQLLSPIEETTLENWIYRAAKLGAPVTLQLVKILASEIQNERSSNHDKNELSHISDRWLIAFGHATHELRRVSRVLSTRRGLRHLIHHHIPNFPATTQNKPSSTRRIKSFRLTQDSPHWHQKPASYSSSNTRQSPPPSLYKLCSTARQRGTSPRFPRSRAPVPYGRALVSYRQILQKETDIREGFETRTTLRKGTAAGQH
jgi:hypothetical protein